MITEIYVDNFRCFSNFRIKPGGFQLWLGDNGSGKTSVMDALRRLQRLMRGEHVADIFQRNSLTSWDLRKEQTFGLSWMIDGEAYQCTVTVEHADQEDKRRIKEKNCYGKSRLSIGSTAGRRTFTESIEPTKQPKKRPPFRRNGIVR
ncbi:MAG: AAA family ATPase [Desulfococcaceae bacterium]